MFGVTTPCVTAVTEQLRNHFDCIVFHATGTGGRKLANSAFLYGVIDVTTTEVCDHLLGGVLSVGADRLSAIARTRVPYVGSVGALDLVNSWAIDTLPAQYAGRNLHRHNPQVTLMRTTAAESRQIGFWIAEKLKQPFHDPIADAALFEAIEQTLRRTRDRRFDRIACQSTTPSFPMRGAKFPGDRRLNRRFNGSITTTSRMRP
jgi:uncharacterized protein (UPF0261 family)